MSDTNLNDQVIDQTTPISNQDHIDDLDQKVKEYDIAFRCLVYAQMSGRPLSSETRQQLESKLIALQPYKLQKCPDGRVDFPDSPIFPL